MPIIYTIILTGHIIEGENMKIKYKKENTKIMLEIFAFESRKDLL